VLDAGFTTPALRPPLDPCQRTRILRLATPPLRNHLLAPELLHLQPRQGGRAGFAG
jgi:hypothetical protein